MKRFIYSGCSFTQYGYPTWGDIIAYDMISQGEVEGAYNLGKGGACNTYIHSQLLLADRAIKFTEDDILGVAWTTPWRHSVIGNFNPHCQEFTNEWVWHAYGNVSHNPYWKHIDNHLEMINTDINLIHKTIMAYTSVNKMYNLKYQARLPSNESRGLRKIMSATEEAYFHKLKTTGVSETTLIAYLESEYREFVKLPSLDYDNKELDIKFIKAFSSHPDMRNHLKFAQGLRELHPDTVKEVNRLATRLDTLLKNIFKEIESEHGTEWNDMMKNLVSQYLDQGWWEYRREPVWTDIFIYNDVAHHNKSYFDF